jgi:hypothetical protein
MIAELTLTLEPMPDGMGGERAGFVLRAWERPRASDDLIVSLELRWPQGGGDGPDREIARRTVRDLVERFLR